MGLKEENAKKHMPQHLMASALAAVINYPLWRASAMGQSGFRVSSSTFMSLHPSLQPYAYAFAPPYKGMVAVILGMTWARAAIFWGSEVGKDKIRKEYPSAHPSFYTLFPPLVVSTLVQIINQPIVRASITLQNPQSQLKNTQAALSKIRKEHGFSGLWHGTSAGILKTVPKYCVAIVVKDYMERVLPLPDPDSKRYKSEKMMRSACKSATAGVAGAALTNPLDVIRNEMFKTNKGIAEVVKSLTKEFNGFKWIGRGMGKNLIAVSVPVGFTIFFTDIFIQFSKHY